MPIVAINSDLGEPVNEARIRKVLPKFRAVTLAGDGPLPHDGRPAALQPGAGSRSRSAARSAQVASRAVDARTGGGGPRRRTRAARPARRSSACGRSRMLFDQAFAVPGTKWRFGLDALFGLVPGLGDIAGALVAVYAHAASRAI